MLTIIVSTLLMTLIINLALKKINLPPIIGYIFTGTIITYLFGLHEAVGNHQLKEVAEFGVVFLMFTIGLEFSLTHLRAMRYEVFVLGLLQIVVTGAVVFVVSHFALGIQRDYSIVISMALSLSSTAIVLKTFNETGEINFRHGKNALGILIMQDIAVIPILLILWFLSSGDGDQYTAILDLIIGGVVLLVVLALLGRFVLEPFLTAIVKTKSDELFITAILFLAIGSSYLAHHFGFSYSLGAFIAGMLIADTKFRHQVEADLIPFRDLLLGIFFITVGMQIDLAILSHNIYLLALLLPSVFAVKFGVIYLLMRLRSNPKTSLKTALSLIQIGEFSLAILEISGSYGILDDSYRQILIVTIVLSMVLTPTILRNLQKVADGVFGVDDMSMQSPKFEAHADVNHPVIILGYGEFGQSVAKTLRANEVSYRIIENNLDAYHNAVRNDEPILFGNATKKEILNVAIKGGLSKVIVAIDNPKKLRHICELISDFVGVGNIIVKVHSFREERLIEDLGIKHIVIDNQASSDVVMQILEEKS